jgi:hypothetical protein
VRTPFFIFAATIAAVVACGARSELRVPPPHHHVDAGEEDAGPDVVDAPPDAPPDVVDAPPDAPPPVDCQDAGITYVYLITRDNILARFYPPSGTIEEIGLIDCPGTQGNDAPFSMAVDRSGIAWVLFQSGDLFRVSTATAACTTTEYVSGQQGFQNFGMGYSANVDDAGGETLYVANDVSNSMMHGQLGSIDISTFTLSFIGTFDGMIGNAELTGTIDGRLYGFGVENTDAGTSFIHLAEIDKTNAHVIGDQFITLPTGNEQIQDWAFAFWGGDFYFFTSTASMNMNGTALVSRYHPGDPSNAAQPVTTFNSPIVGAGVSTCAPAQ